MDFTAYYRGDPSRKRGDGGSGLGLTIVSELVKLHNGRITVRSAEGRGTTVTVLLPAGRAAVGSSPVGGVTRALSAGTVGRFVIRGRPVIRGPTTTPVPMPVERGRRHGGVVRRS